MSRLLAALLPWVSGACSDGTFMRAAVPIQAPQFELAWGQQGHAPGQFVFPVDISVAGDGTVFVVDLGDRVQAFTNDGVFLRRWPIPQLGNGRGPLRIEAAPQDRVHVLTGGRVFHFDQQGKPLGLWDLSSDPHGLVEIGDLTVDANGFVYLVSASGELAKLDGEGRILERWPGSEPGARGTAILLGAGILSDGSLIVADRNARRARVFTTEGVFLRAWDLVADPGALADLAVDGRDHVYAGHVRRSVIGVYDDFGELEATFGVRGDAPGAFRNATGYAADRRGNVFVADTSNHRVLKFRASP